MIDFLLTHNKAISHTYKPFFYLLDNGQLYFLRHIENYWT